jgi:thiazole synthase
MNRETTRGASAADRFACTRRESRYFAGVMTAPLTLTVNGEPRRSAAATIAELVGELGLKPEKVAVEHNGTIVPRSTLGEAALADGDVLEIVHFVGGGSR